jgi:hypothetical protein
MSTTFSFSASTTDPRLAALIAKVIADFQVEHRDEPVLVQGSISDEGADGGDKTDAPLVQQIVDALTYQPLHPHQVLTLRTWYDATDWVHVGVLQQQLIKNGLARNPQEAVSRVRGLLAGFAIRMAQKVNHPAGRTKLATFVDVDYKNGSASHRLTDSGRDAVKRALERDRFKREHSRRWRSSWRIPGG